MKDRNIDLCVIGEGEATLADIIDKYISNGRKKLNHDELIGINGLAFSEKTLNNNILKFKTTGDNNIYSQR